jgi:hypothetical protein
MFMKLAKKFGTRWRDFTGTRRNTVKRISNAWFCILIHKSPHKTLYIKLRSRNVDDERYDGGYMGDCE